MRDALYFLAPDGVLYRVYDSTFRDGRHQAANPPAPGATNRIFRPKDGHRRLYRFANGEDRTPTDEALARQLRAAEYLPTEPVGPVEQDPR